MNKMMAEPAEWEDSRPVMKRRIELSPDSADRSRRFSFSLTDDIWELRVRCRRLSQRGGALQFMLWDPERLRAAAVDPEDELILSEDWASPGMYKGLLCSGEWHCELKTPKQHKGQSLSSFAAELSIVVRRKETRLLRGDLHMHSIHSDGSFRTTELCRFAREAGLNFISITDHNETAQNLEELSDAGLIVIPGSEYSTSGGDANIFGLAEPYCRPSRDSRDDVKSVLRSCRNRGAIVSVNHPFLKSNGWRWGLEDFNFGFIEVWRGGWGPHNERAVEWWHKELSRGKRIMGLGGSDIHHGGQGRWLGTPPTVIVRAEKPTVRGILEGLRKGDMAILRTPESPYVFIDSDRCVPNDPKAPAMSVSVSIGNFIPGSLSLHTARGVVKTLALREEADIPEEGIKYPLDEEDLFCRAEYRPFGSCEEPFCLSNPFFGDGGSNADVYMKSHYQERSNDTRNENRG